MMVFTDLVHFVSACNGFLAESLEEGRASLIETIQEQPTAESEAQPEGLQSIVTESHPTTEVPCSDKLRLADPVPSGVYLDNQHNIEFGTQVPKQQPDTRNVSQKEPVQYNQRTDQYGDQHIQSSIQANNLNNFVKQDGSYGFQRAEAGQFEQIVKEQPVLSHDPRVQGHMLPVQHPQNTFHQPRQIDHAFQHGQRLPEFTHDHRDNTYAQDQNRREFLPNQRVGDLPIDHRGKDFPQDQLGRDFPFEQRTGDFRNQSQWTPPPQGQHVGLDRPNEVVNMPQTQAESGQMMNNTNVSGLYAKTYERRNKKKRPANYYQTSEGPSAHTNVATTMPPGIMMPPPSGMPPHSMAPPAAYFPHPTIPPPGYHGVVYPGHSQAGLIYGGPPPQNMMAEVRQPQHNVASVHMHPQAVTNVHTIPSQQHNVPNAVSVSAQPSPDTGLNRFAPPLGVVPMGISPTSHVHSQGVNNSIQTALQHMSLNQSDRDRTDMTQVPLYKHNMQLQPAFTQHLPQNMVHRAPVQHPVPPHTQHMRMGAPQHQPPPAHSHRDQSSLPRDLNQQHHHPQSNLGLQHHVPPGGMVPPPHQMVAGYREDHSPAHQSLPPLIQANIPHTQPEAGPPISSQHALDAHIVHKERSPPKQTEHISKPVEVSVECVVKEKSVEQEPTQAVSVEEEDAGFLQFGTVDVQMIAEMTAKKSEDVKVDTPTKAEGERPEKSPEPVKEPETPVEADQTTAATVVPEAAAAVREKSPATAPSAITTSPAIASTESAESTAQGTTPVAPAHPAPVTTPVAPAQAPTATPVTTSSATPVTAQVSTPGIASGPNPAVPVPATGAWGSKKNNWSALFKKDGVRPSTGIVIQSNHTPSSGSDTGSNKDRSSQEREETVQQPVSTSEDKAAKQLGGKWQQILPTNVHFLAND